MLGDGQRRGMPWHSGLVVEASTGVVAGLAAAKVFYRQRAPKQETRTQRLNRTRASSLWGDVVDAAGSPPTGSQWVHVFDRGGDNFEALCHIVTQQCDGVIRASQRKRKVRLDSGESVALDQAIQTASRVGPSPC